MSNYQFNSNQIDVDKQNIYTHPLFPLLKLLMEKCELATNNPELINEENFYNEIKMVIEKNEAIINHFTIQNTSLDELILKSIQVLRIHLLELEKVNELCKDFCHRYITCLKVKLNSETLIKQEIDCFSDDNDDSLNETANDENNLTNTNDESTTTTASTSNVDDNSLNTSSSNNNKRSGVDLNSSSSDCNKALITATPLTQIGCTNSIHNVQMNNFNFDFDDDPLNKRKNKRGVLPKSATNIMKQWLFQHIVHPYPTEDEKKQIAVQTNLTLIQVNNWFINARRRILQPMLEASNPDMTKKKRASSAITSKPYQNNRYWPANLANMSVKAHESDKKVKTEKYLNNSKNDENHNDEDDDDEEGDDEDAASTNSNDIQMSSHLDTSKSQHADERGSSSMCSALKIENLLGSSTNSYYTSQAYPIGFSQFFNASTFLPTTNYTPHAALPHIPIGLNESPESSFNPSTSTSSSSYIKQIFNN